MKKLLLSLLLFIACFAQGQTISKAIYQVDAAGNKLAGAIVLPTDYATTSDSLVLMVFNHGSREGGNGTTGTLGDVLNGSGVFANGSPLTVAGAAAGPMTAVSPTNGKTYRFAVFGLQGLTGWCAQAAQVDYVLMNSILKSYRIMKGGVIITGLSAGAETSWEAIAGPNASLYAGAVAMSTPAINGWICDFALPAANFSKVWAFHGAQDGNLTDPVNTTHAIGYLDAFRKGLTHLTLYPGNHCCWNAYYAPSYRENITYYYNGVKFTKAMNIYEFAAACVSGASFVFDTTGSPAVIVQQVPAGVTKAVENITISGNTVTLDASASIGAIGSYDWYVTTSTGAYVNLSGMGLHPDQKTVIAKLGNGTYNVRLTVQDYGGAKDVATATITVPATATGPTAVATFAIGGVTHTAYSDGTWK